MSKERVLGSQVSRPGFGFARNLEIEWLLLFQLHPVASRPSGGPWFKGSRKLFVGINIACSLPSAMCGQVAMLMGISHICILI